MILKRMIPPAMLCIALFCPATARAGTFDVVACDAAPGFVNNSWDAQVTHGGMVAFNACPSSDDAMRGLGARTGYPYPSGWTVPTGAAARWFFWAPGGTVIVGVRANAYFSRKNHRWQVGLSNGSQLLAGCYASAADTGGTCFDGLSADEYLPVPGNGAVYTETFCAYGPCPVGGGDWYGWASLTWVSVTVLDETLPSINNPGGSLWTDQWISGTRRVSFDAGDNTGIKDVRVLIDGREMARAGRGCDPTVKTCPNWPGAVLDVATATGIADGRHRLSLEATDRGDNRAALQRDVLVDNTPPAAPTDLAVDGGDGWKPTNRFTLRWTNPVQTAAPIAGADYRLCPVPVTAGPCLTGSRTDSKLAEIKDFAVPGLGDWTLTLWLRDAAGNSRPETSPPPMHLRFDPDPPVVALRSQDPDDPARIRVAATDATSGIARGEIAIRRRGGKTWHEATAQLESGGFSAMLDDEHLRDGVYQLRAHAWDAAGNERSTDQRVSGEPARVVLPLRIKTRMRVGKKRKLHVRGARRGQRRVRIVYLRRPVVGHGRRLRIRGRLTAPGGNPLTGVSVDVAARLALQGVDFQPVATLTTSRSGRFTYLVPAGPSRVLRFRYAGAPKIRSQTRDVQVRVRAASSIRVDPRRVVNGEAVTFSGGLRGRFNPPTGKLMELQFFDRGRWRTFRTFRAAPSSGEWSYSYRFDGTRGTRRYRFRVQIPKENGYPFSTGRSRHVAVTVRGL